MSENQLITIIDEPSAKAIEQTGKTIEKSLDVLTKSGGYVAEFLGDVPHNVAGIIGD